MEIIEKFPPYIERCEKNCWKFVYLKIKTAMFMLFSFLIQAWSFRQVFVEKKWKWLSLIDSRWFLLFLDTFFVFFLQGNDQDQLYCRDDLQVLHKEHNLSCVPSCGKDSFSCLQSCKHNLRLRVPWRGLQLFPQNFLEALYMRCMYLM